MRTELVLGIPYPHYFFPSGTPSTYTLVGPDHQIAKATSLGTPQTDATNGGYLITITPQELGAYTLIVKAGGGASVHIEQFEAVQATTRETSLGVGLSHHSLISIDSPHLHGAVNTILRNNGAAVVSWASKGKQVVPMDGYIYGLEVHVHSLSNFAALTSVKLAAVDPLTGLVRGISEDFKAQMTTTNAWNTATFAKPVLAKAGDWIVLQVDDTGLSNAYNFTVNDASATLSAVQKIEYVNSALSLSAANTIATAYLPLTFKIKLRMAPPHIAIAGHSVFSGYPVTGSFYDLYTAFLRSADIAALLGDRLGLRVLNVSVSSQNISSYVLDAGFFDTFLKDVFPSVLVYDTVGSDYGYTSDTDYFLMLDKLISQCVKYKIELVMVEGPPRGEDLTTGRVAGHRARRKRVHTWARNHGIPCIPMEWLLGMNDGDTYFRDTQKVLTNPTVDYTLVGDSKVHLSASGLVAVVQGIANCFRPRRHMQSLERAERRDLDSISLASETAASSAQH